MKVMVIKYIVVAVLLMLEVGFCQAYTPSASSGVCYKLKANSVVAEMINYRTTYTQYVRPYSCGFLGWRRCHHTYSISLQKSFIIYFLNTTYHVVEECCSGYVGTPPNCQPYCSGDCCLNGCECILPEICTSTPGWTGRCCEIDVDECEDGNHTCDQICLNTNGSYSCGCNPGFVLESDQQTCRDINECWNMYDNNCTHICINTVGSYYCSCLSGYKLTDDNHTCTDIKECLIGTHICSQLCVELDGGYRCSCYDGYDLAEDGITCEARGNCTIAALKPTNLIITGGVLHIPYGTRNVLIQCNCSDVTGMALDPIRWFVSNGTRVHHQTHHEYIPGAPYFTKAPNDINIVLVIPVFDDTNDAVYICGVGINKEPNIDIGLAFDHAAEFYFGYFHRNHYTYDPFVILTTTEKQPVFYLIEAPDVGYYNNGTITADHEVILDLPSILTVTSSYDQHKGICIKTSSNRVTVQSVHHFYYYYVRYYYVSKSESSVVMPVINLCTSEYIYYPITVNSSWSYYYNSSILVIGTEDNTVMNLTVTQSVTISVGNTIANPIPGREYSFVIKRLQTVYIESPDDLTGSKIVTDKQVSIFSGHQDGYILHSPSSHLVEQILPTTLWGRVYYVMPLSNIQKGYAIKIFSSKDNVIKIYCNSSIFTTTLNGGEFLVKEFSYNDFCTVKSFSEVIVAQFPLGNHSNYYSYYDNDFMFMVLVPSKKQYYNKFKFSTINNDVYNPHYGYYYYKVFYGYANIIVMAQHYQPERIYLIADGVNRSLDTQQWIALKVNNITEAYATQVNITTYNVAEIFHTNETALMTVIVYGFSGHGSHGTAISNNVNKGLIIDSEGLEEITIELFSNHYNLSIDCKAMSFFECYEVKYKWHKANKLISTDPVLVINNLKVEDAGQYQCTAINSLGGTVSINASVDIKVPAPKIITQPTDSSAATPFSAVFVCTAKAYGNLIFEWKRSNSYLPQKSFGITDSSLDSTTSSLFIPDVTSDDVGEYYCDVWANNKASRSKVARLQYSGRAPLPTVQFFPSSSISLGINTFELSIKCMHYGNIFQYSYMWEKQKDILPSRVYGIESSLLTIVNLTTEDAGMYRCRLSNSTGRITSNFTKLTVTVNPPVFLKHPISATVNISTSVIFNCTAKGFNIASLIWRKVGSTRLPSTVERITNNLTNEVISYLRISKIAGYYTGKYYCIATNTAGETYSNEADLIVQVPCPEMIRIPVNTTVLPGKTANFHCLALSFGGLIYDWKRKNASLPESTVKTYVKWKFSHFLGHIAAVHHLAVMNIKPSDEGWYCCIVTNECGYVERCAWLEVNTLPSITTQPESVLLKIGSNQTSGLFCLANGRAPIYYQWEKYQSVDNSWIKPSHRAENITSNNLVFNGITEKDEGIYRCIVTNDDGSVVSDNATITVYGPPKITYINPNKISLEGTKSMLKCVATNDRDSNQPLKIQWYNSIGDQIMSNESRIVIHNASNPDTDEVVSELSFDPVNRTDNGVYTCKAFNDPKCYTKVTTTLTVEYPPCISINPFQSPHIVGVGANLVLYCSACGSPLPKVQWHQNNTAIIQRPPEYILVPTSSPHTTIYTCVASNNAGNMTQTVNKSITVIVQENCPPIIEPYGILYYNQNKTEAYIVCRNGSFFSAKCKAGQWKPTPPLCKAA